MGQNTGTVMSAWPQYVTLENHCSTNNKRDIRICKTWATLAELPSCCKHGKHRKHTVVVTNRNRDEDNKEFLRFIKRNPFKRELTIPRRKARMRKLCALQYGLKISKPVYLSGKTVITSKYSITKAS